MTDKETQLNELAGIIERHHIGCGLPKECYTKCVLCAAEVIYEAGYRNVAEKDSEALNGK